MGASPTPRLLRGAALALACAGALQGQGHWAYRRPVRPPVPEASRGQHPVDAFVARRRAAIGLRSAPREQPARLLRRLHLDLVGLPPSVEAVEGFEADPSDEAWAEQVEALLASPRFGEHWARHWLDLARYADSNGFQADQLRESWAYRDWVIDALNDDMPFDQFTIEQLAGDLLPSATVAQRVATGFHRTVTCNVEAGVHPEANRVDQVADRVNTTATVWLGTTMECAQCHAHKYDPFSQRDYYGLFAFFNNTPIEVENPNGQQGVQFDFSGPWMELPLDEPRAAQKAARERERESLRKALERAVAAATREQPAWEEDLRARLSRAPGWAPLEVKAVATTGGEAHELLEDGSVLISGPVPGTTTYRVRVETELEGIRALRLEALTHASLPGTGPGRGDPKRPNFILSELALTARAAGSAQAESVRLRALAADFEQRGWPAADAVDGDPKTGWAIAGAFGEDHWAAFETLAPIGRAGGTSLELVLEQRYGKGRTLGRFRLSAYCGDPSLLTVPDDVAQSLRAASPSREQQERVREHFLAGHAEVRRLRDALEEVEGQLRAIVPSKTLVMVELDEPRQTCVMQRGDYLQPGEPVAPHTPAALHPFDESLPRNRLGLARWLVDPRNPLTARVAVNRWWSQIFGRGLVVTEEDFGSRGAAPSHPALLDWLAVELVESGWSMKHVLRCIVTSATYRQAAQRRGASDPDNVWLARGPRFRMSAEMIRDQALAASGLLSLEMGGPSVFPPQPDGLWRQTGRNEPKYVAATDSDRFRRGIYVVWRRAAPYPSFVLFDGPDRAACHPTRSRTNTPMQALTLMNDPAYVEAALGLARRVLTELRPLASDAGRIERMFRLVLSRRPAPVEAAHLLQALARERRRLQEDASAAEALLDQAASIGGADGVAARELAAWFCVASVLLNLDEGITKG